MKIRISILFAILLLASVSCREEIAIDSLEKMLFMKQDTVGLYNLGDKTFKYNSQLHQQSYNLSRKQYRLQTDEQDSCLNVIFEKYPQNTGDIITTSLDYRDTRNIINHTVDYECSKIVHNQIWLWNKKDLVGIILPQYYK